MSLSQWKPLLVPTLKRISRWTYALGFLVLLLYVFLAILARETPDATPALASQAVQLLIPVMLIHVLARIGARALES
ncbi:hypothetical protein ACS7SF_22875 (plasmid) [Ralstonia sp. 25C]|uniref:hypothetical protein n=1 Tax=Ralstonia sp. 25C TaxID=3447363 RepID=UPI003F75201A